MIILKRGTKGQRKYNTICKECNSLVQAVESELKFESYPPREPQPLAREKCPACLADIIFYK